MLGGGVVVLDDEGGAPATADDDRVDERNLQAGLVTGHDLQGGGPVSLPAAQSVPAATSGDGGRGADMPFGASRHAVAKDVGPDDVDGEEDERPQHCQVGDTQHADEELTHVSHSRRGVDEHASGTNLDARSVVQFCRAHPDPVDDDAVGRSQILDGHSHAVVGGPHVQAGMHA